MKLVHTFIFSKLDYCNMLIIWIPSNSLLKRQYIQTCADRILIPYTGFLSPPRPLSKSVSSHISASTVMALHIPKEILSSQAFLSNLRSRNNFVHMVKTKLHTMGYLVLCSAAPLLQSSLLDHLKGTTDC